MLFIFVIVLLSSKIIILRLLVLLVIHLLFWPDLFYKCDLILIVIQEILPIFLIVRLFYGIV